MSLAKSPVRPRRGNGILGPDGKALGCFLDLRYQSDSKRSKKAEARSIFFSFTRVRLSSIKLDKNSEVSVFIYCDVNLTSN